MSLIKLSALVWVQSETISGCELFKKEDDCHYVRWFTSLGDFESDAFTGRVTATNYVNDVNKELARHEKEFGEFEGDSD